MMMKNGIMLMHWTTSKRRIAISSIVPNARKSGSTSISWRPRARIWSVPNATFCVRCAESDLAFGLWVEK